MEETRKGMLLVVSGPSGTGKGTLVKMLLAQEPDFGFSISATTRAPRPGEKDGEDYYFITEERYDELVREGAFLEHAGFCGRRYGTLRSEVDRLMAQGKNVVLDIESQGARNVMALVPDCVSVFILPPSMAELRRRLIARGTETPEQVERRLETARQEIAQMDQYQYIIVNGDLDAAYERLKHVALAEKQRSSRYFPVVPEE